MDIEQYNKEIDEALLQIKNGEFITQEDLEEESKTWQANYQKLFGQKMLDYN